MDKMSLGAPSTPANLHLESADIDDGRGSPGLVLVKQHPMAEANNRLKRRKQSRSRRHLDSLDKPRIDTFKEARDIKHQQWTAGSPSNAPARAALQASKQSTERYLPVINALRYARWFHPLRHKNARSSYKAGMGSLTTF